MTLVVLGGIAAGCFGAPRGVDCSQYSACSSDTVCGECLDVPGCGPLRVGRVEACAESCPIAFECSVSTDCPAQIRCDGLVPGRALTAAVSPARER